MAESLDGTVISAEGDSGAPVFIANSDGTVALAGVLVGGQGEEREATNFAYSWIGSMKEDFHMITDEQLITYKHPDGVPMITKVDFPSSIPGDGALHPGTVTFTHSDAGINWAQFDVLQLSCDGCSFPPFGFDPGVAALKNGQFTFNMWCEGDFNWTMELTLRDNLNVSDPYLFSVKCNPVSAQAKVAAREMAGGRGAGSP